MKVKYEFPVLNVHREELESGTARTPVSIYRYIGYIGFALLVVSSLTFFLTSCEDEWAPRPEGIYGKITEVNFVVGGNNYGAG